MVENSYGNEEFLLDVPFTADEVTNAVRKLKEEKSSRAWWSTCGTSEGRWWSSLHSWLVPSLDSASFWKWFAQICNSFDLSCTTSLSTNSLPYFCLAFWISYYSAQQTSSLSDSISQSVLLNMKWTFCGTPSSLPLLPALSTETTQNIITPPPAYLWLDTGQYSTSTLL